MCVCVCVTQGFIVTVCVLRAAGGLAALSPVTVGTVHRVHLMRALVSVHLASEEPPVSAVSSSHTHMGIYVFMCVLISGMLFQSVLRVTLVIAVVRRVRSVPIAMALVIT